MQFDWTTFALEIVNFLVLVWILKRFLYRPVLNVIGSRRAAIEKTLSDAKNIENNAQALKAEYEKRKVEWERECELARVRLKEEINQERERLVAELNASLATLREKNRVLEERRQQEAQRVAEEHAIALGAAFSARLLQRAAGPELEGKIVDLALQEVQSLPADLAASLQHSKNNGHSLAVVTSAFTMKSEHRAALAEALAAVIGGQLATEFHEDSSLLAGISIEVGPWIMQANLRDELKFFARTEIHAN